MIKAQLILLCVILILGGCASSPITSLDLTNTEIVDFPNIGIPQTRNLGERLVAKGIRTTGKALQISKSTVFGKKEGEAAIMTCAWSVAPSTQFYKGLWSKNGEPLADCYGPFPLQVTQADGGTNFNCPGTLVMGDVCQDRDTENFFAAVVTIRQDLKQSSRNLSITEKVSTSQTSFIQELLYNGRVGSNLKFIYREFSDDMIRPAFSQEVQYDLSKSDEIGFKSVRMEVLDATNTVLKYKLLSNFED
ncbi:immunoglobulin domain-containing protein [Pseudomonadales bacterium]|nr:immunoglobulin domain-containing protein [Pseudomonadales bacterium]